MDDCNEVKEADEDIGEFQMHEKVVEGNVYHGVTNDIDVIEEEED